MWICITEKEKISCLHYFSQYFDWAREPMRTIKKKKITKKKPFDKL